MPQLQSATPGSEVDVVVVGGGLAGLMAARRLVEARKTVHVLEARDRVGGRTLSEDVGGARFDLGGQWLGPGQTRVEALVREFGIHTFPTWHTGKKILDLGGKISTYDSKIPSISPLHLIVLQVALSVLERMRKRVDPEAPGDTKNAAALDASTVEAMSRKLIPSRRVRALFDVGVRTIFGAEPSEISVLYFLTYLQAGGGFLKLAEIEDGAQQDRFVEGAQSLALGLAAPLQNCITFNAPVLRIAQSAQGVEVLTPQKTLFAKRVILAIPPPFVGRIHHDQPLSPQRDQLSQRMFMGQTIKCIALYSTAFWRDAGFSGEVLSTRGPVDVVFDNTSHDLRHPALLAFIVGQHGRDLGLLPAAERRRVVLESLARYFGPAALTPTTFAEKDWAADPWTRGCPVANLGAGTLHPCGDALRRPEGFLHFAGTETATAWTGYMEGALQSAERASQETIHALL